MATGFNLDIRGDLRNIRRDLSDIQRQMVPAATSSALNTAASKSRTVATNEISATKAIRPKRIVRNRLFIVRSTIRTLSAEIQARLWSVSVIEMVRQHLPASVQRKRKGVRAGGTFYRGAFFAYRGRRGYGVYKRLGKKRFPIQKQVIPLLPEADTILTRAIQTIGGPAWRREFERFMARRLRRPSRHR